MSQKQTSDVWPSLAYVAINKHGDAAQTVDLPESAHGRRVICVCRDSAPTDQISNPRLALEPAEVTYPG
jgi:alpha-D-ribose 1-methylphosphonate 5-phosphate C-P lyase